MHEASDFTSLMNNIYIQICFKLGVLYSDYPSIKSVIGSGGKDKRFEKNIFTKAKDVFSEKRRNENDVEVIGMYKNKGQNIRVKRYIMRKYVDFDHKNLQKFKVIIPVSNGSGAFGEVLSNPFVGGPLVGYTRSFIGIGSFDNEIEATNCLKYIKTKFLRTCLGILKATQMNNKEVWNFVPLQDFSDSSDIDWSKSIHEIDLQLYKKYSFDEKEINFIESRVKEMA